MPNDDQVLIRKYPAGEDDAKWSSPQEYAMRIREDDKRVDAAVGRVVADRSRWRFSGIDIGGAIKRTTCFQDQPCPVDCRKHEVCVHPVVKAETSK